MHHAQDKDVVNAGHMVPVQLTSGVNAAATANVAQPATSQGPASQAGAVDPFLANKNAADGATAHSALSSGVQPAGIRAGVSRPQPPETPGQIVLEWSKTSDAPAYSSAPQAPNAPVFDAATNGNVVR